MHPEPPEGGTASPSSQAGEGLDPGSPNHLVLSCATQRGRRMQRDMASIMMSQLQVAIPAGSTGFAFQMESG